MHILLSNDDGIHADGLRRLREGLLRALPGARVSVCAPDREQSATSHSLTLTAPLRIRQHAEGIWSVTGTPTDCVLLALKALLAEDPPDLLLSGINHGPNMGEDVHYSGTVAAAMEGLICGLPSIALSLGSRGTEPGDWEAAEAFVAETLPRWLRRGWDEETLLNVNLPAGARAEIQGVRVCKLGSRVYEDVITRKLDPRGQDYYWIGGSSVARTTDAATDFVLHRQGWITVTPLHLDLTDYKAMVELEDLQEEVRP
jgi:5'-nucleotidase